MVWPTLGSRTAKEQEQEVRMSEYADYFMLIKQVSALSHDVCTYTIRLYDNVVIFSNRLLYIPRLASLLCIRGDRFVEATSTSVYCT